MSPAAGAVVETGNNETAAAVCGWVCGGLVCVVYMGCEVLVSAGGWVSWHGPVWWDEGCVGQGYPEVCQDVVVDVAVTWLLYFLGN